jgi:uncharacterized protein (DUF58 family)
MLALGTPLALLLALLRPDLWVFGPAWVGLCMAAMVFDLVLAPPVSKAEVEVESPDAVGVGDPFTIILRVLTGGSGRPPDAKVAVSVNALLSEKGRIDAPLRVREDGLSAVIDARAMRRGSAFIDQAWVTWTGPLGLVRVQRRQPIQRPIAVVPSIRAVNQHAVPLFTRDAEMGQRLVARVGEGSEFESMVRFMPGFDRRVIDWKQSARHIDLLAKQFETERDNRIVLAIDHGRMMSDPVILPDGIAEPRLDHAISSALALAYVALRFDDRVSIASFAGAPWVPGRIFSRSRDFAALRRMMATIEYSHDETNFTYGLATLAASLKRRSMIIVFTEFSDATSAELMLRAVERLVSKHLVMFVVASDTELEAETAEMPSDTMALVGATIAADMLRDRRLVLARLRHMGALVVEAPHTGLTGNLLATYIRAKRKGMI